MKKKLYDSNIELTNLYEDLTASDEELRQQFDELMDTQKSLMASEERYKIASEEVGKLNTELEQRVITRTHELQLAMQELEAFAYTVSHDLKSPLRAIDGYSKIILEDSKDELKEEVIDMMSHIRGICSEMIEMINKLLQYSTTSRKELQLENVDCNELFTTSYREAKYSVPDRRIEFKIETGLPNVQADRTLLKQVLNNIFSNAIKFTKNREIAYIIAGATITENEYIFYVKDNGAGFDKNYSEKLFGLFQRLHTSDEFEGSGIGLITIKKIIEKHGGRTWIEGELNKGAVVYFSLPNNGLREEGQ
jgi:light-regulated signal transduction histidine kinase (bacteriophytochrome)